MSEFWNFLLTMEDGSGETVPAVLLVMALGVLISVSLTFAEYRFHKAIWLWLSLQGIVISVLFVAFLMLGAGLSEVLLALLLLLLVRIVFIFAKERNES